MSIVTCSAEHTLQAAVQQDGFAFVQSTAMRELLERHGSLSDWTAFADSWNLLERDEYMADGGRYRRRRHAVYETRGSGEIIRAAHQPHWQPIDYNPLNGGVPRWFAPIEPEIGRSACLITILGFCRSLFNVLSSDSPAWRIEVHQFRIEARHEEPGLPTPEGLHRDGVDYVLVLLINRRNIASGVTSIYGAEGGLLGSFTLTDPFDAALVDDNRVAHGVTPVKPLNPSESAYRDVLVVTFKRNDID